MNTGIAREVGRISGLNGVAMGEKYLSGSRPSGVMAGIFAKWGQSLPVVERVRGNLRIADFTDAIINGQLLTDHGQISVRFDAVSRGPMPVLRRFIESAAAVNITTLSVVDLPIWINARPWVEEGGVIVLLVRKFGIEKSSVPSVDAKEAANHF